MATITIINNIKRKPSVEHLRDNRNYRTESSMGRDYYTLVTHEMFLGDKFNGVGFIRFRNNVEVGQESRLNGIRVYNGENNVLIAREPISVNTPFYIKRTSHSSTYGTFNVEMEYSEDGNDYNHLILLTIVAQ